MWNQFGMKKSIEFFEYMGVSLKKVPTNNPSCWGCYLADSRGRPEALCDPINDYLDENDIGNCTESFNSGTYSYIRLVNK